MIEMPPRCDTRDSPVVIACRKALETGNVNYALVRVLPSVVPELTAAFERAMRGRRASGDARDLAGDRFFETAVRLNRAGEGEPYTGLKPVGFDEGPVVPRAEKEIETGDVPGVIGFVLAAVDEDPRARFDRVMQTKGYDVRAGRAFVRAYLGFIVFAHHLYGYVTGGGGHPR